MYCVRSYNFVLYRRIVWLSNNTNNGVGLILNLKMNTKMAYILKTALLFQMKRNTKPRMFDWAFYFTYHGKTGFSWLLTKKNQPIMFHFWLVFNLYFWHAAVHEESRRNIPLTGALLSPYINHWHGNETVLTKREMDTRIQMQKHYIHRHLPPASLSHKGTSANGATSE